MLFGKGRSGESKLLAQWYEIEEKYQNGQTTVQVD